MKRGTWKSTVVAYSIKKGNYIEQPNTFKIIKISVYISALSSACKKTELRFLVGNILDILFFLNGIS